MTDALRTLGIGASLEYQDVIHIALSEGFCLACGTTNEYWGCDLNTSDSQVTESFTLSARSDDERWPHHIAREIAGVVKRLNEAQEVIGKRWIVQADPALAGQHVNHDYRFITTEGYDFRDVGSKGVVVCAMRDLVAIREVSKHIVDAHNASLAKKSLENCTCDANPESVKSCKRHNGKTDCTTGESTEQTRLLETATDIAYIAGGRKYYSGDSRADIATFVEWARAFEALRVVDSETCEETFMGKDYMTAVEEWTSNHLSDMGWTSVSKVNDDMVRQFVYDVVEHLKEAREERVTEHKLAMLDGGIAQELIERGDALFGSVADDVKNTLTLFERITSELCMRGWDASSEAGIVTVRTTAKDVINFEKGEDYWRVSHYQNGTPTMSDELRTLAGCDDAIKIVDAFERSMNGGA